ncbi:MAG: ZIP family metal transporter [Erysipelotrichaceae bacterium]|nr:ZIP family metal transporter [Erysipelotrichaceae bacterium]
MNTVLYILVITALAGVGGTGLGSILSCLFKKDSNRIVSLLLSFAAGVMLAVVCFDLLSEALIESGVFLVIAGLSFGYIIIGILNAIIDSKTNKEVAHIDKSHPKTADSLEELTHANHLQEHMEGRQPRSGLFIAGLIMAAAIALHNVPEGIVIGSSFAKSAKELVLDRAGITMAIVIGLHNIPEGMAVAVPLISGGMSKFKAVLVTALTGSPTIVGALIGYYIGVMGPTALALSLSFASGAMLYVVFAELLPESILMYKSKMPAVGIFVGIIVGLIIIYV